MCGSTTWHSNLACVSERAFGKKRFSAVLRELGVTRTETVEIGRWIVHSAYRATGRPSGQLAAASAALAMMLRIAYRPSEEL